MNEIKTTIPPAYSWASQVKQYPKVGPVGMSVFEGWIDGLALPVLCLLWRDKAGLLRGVLNYYQENSRWEDKGNFNIWVDPDWQRLGIGTELVLDAIERWQLDLAQQRYTKDGAAFINALQAKGILT